MHLLISSIVVAVLFVVVDRAIEVYHYFSQPIHKALPIDWKHELKGGR